MSEEIEDLAQRLFIAAFGIDLEAQQCTLDELKTWGKATAVQAFVLAEAFAAERRMRQQQGRRA